MSATSSVPPGSVPPSRSQDSATAFRRSLDGLLQVFDDVLASPDPAVVFASVAQACVPTVCAEATILANTEGAESGQLAGDSVVIPILVEPVDGDAGYSALLHLRFDDRRAGSDDAALGQIIVDRAVALVDRERATAATARMRAEVDALGRALDSSREIGVAIGIVMARHNLTATQTFDLFRRVSQRQNTKIRTLALDVIATGQLDLPAGVTINGPDGPFPGAPTVTEPAAPR